MLGLVGGVVGAVYNRSLLASAPSVFLSIIVSKVISTDASTCFENFKSL